MEAKIKNRDFLNPLVLLLLIIIFSILLALGDIKIYIAVLCLSLVQSFYISFKDSYKNLIIISALLLSLYIIKLIDLGLISGAITGMIFLLLKFYPVFIIGSTLVSSSTSALMSAFRKLYLPNYLCVALIVGIKFFHEIKVRVKEIRNGMRTRDLNISIFHIVRSFELYLIPLVYKCLNISETLTSSIISKGVEYEGDKTSYKKIVFSFFDILYLSISLALVGSLIWQY